MKLTKEERENLQKATEIIRKYLISSKMDKEWYYWEDVYYKLFKYLYGKICPHCGEILEDD